MTPGNRVVLCGFAALVICIALVSCSGDRPSSGDDQLDAMVTAELARMSSGGPGHGFVCFGDAKGGVGCVCNDDAPAGDIYSCVGMERVCNSLGTGQICNPSTNRCTCVALFKKG